MNSHPPVAVHDAVRSVYGLVGSRRAATPVRSIKGGCEPPSHPRIAAPAVVADCSFSVRSEPYPSSTLTPGLATGGAGFEEMYVG